MTDTLALMDAAARDTSLPYDEWSEANRAFKEALAEAYRTGQNAASRRMTMELHKELEDYMAGHNLPVDTEYAHLLPHDLCHRILVSLAADRREVPADAMQDMVEAYDDLRRYIYDKTAERREYSIGRFRDRIEPIRRAAALSELAAGDADLIGGE